MRYASIHTWLRFLVFGLLLKKYSEQFSLSFWGPFKLPKSLDDLLQVVGVERITGLIQVAILLQIGLRCTEKNPKSSSWNCSSNSTQKKDFTCASFSSAHCTTAQKAPLQASTKSTTSSCPLRSIFELWGFYTGVLSQRRRRYFLKRAWRVTQRWGDNEPSGKNADSRKRLH